MTRNQTARLSDVNRNGTADLLRLRYTCDDYGNRSRVVRQIDDELGGVSSSWLEQSVDSTTNRLATSGYDAAGNMLDLHGDTFQWYPLSRLWTRKGLGRSYVYAYTSSGERLVTLDRLNDRVTITLRDLDNRVIRELVHSNATYTWSRDWIHAGSRLLASVGDDGTRHYHLDHLGTPRLITDQSGNELSYAACTPYGLPLMGEGTERSEVGHSI